MKGILIDPITKSISGIEFNGDVRAALSDRKNDVVVWMFTPFFVSRTDVLLEDNSGQGDKHFFFWKGRAAPMSGRGLLLGIGKPTPERPLNWASTTLTVREVEEK